MRGAAPEDPRLQGPDPRLSLKRRLVPRRGWWLSLGACLSERPLGTPAEGAAALGNPPRFRGDGWQLQGPLLATTSVSVAFLGDRFGRDIQSLDVIGADTQRWQLQGGPRPIRGRSARDGDLRIGIIAGHWIDPGPITGAPGEREFNKAVADAITDQLTERGWTVYRPDRDAKGLEWDDYLRWVARQSRRGTPVLEIHGQGASAAIDGVATGVIGCRASPINQCLADSFGFFPMDWEGFAVPRQGGVILESFVTDEVNSMPENQREAAAQQLGTRVSDAICTAQAKVQTNMTEIKHGCSPTGCPIGKYGHQLEREAEEKKMLEPDHPLGASLLLKESLQHPETSSWHPG